MFSSVERTLNGLLKAEAARGQSYAASLFETAIIERYGRLGSSVEGVLVAIGVRMDGHRRLSGANDACKNMLGE